MSNLLAQAINCDDPDRAAKIIREALGIESDDVANYCFPTTWPADREQRARYIDEWLKTEARYLGLVTNPANHLGAAGAGTDLGPHRPIRFSRMAWALASRCCLAALMAAANSASLASQAIRLPSWAGPAAALAAALSAFFTAVPARQSSQARRASFASSSPMRALACASCSCLNAATSAAVPGALVTASAARAFRRWM